MKRSAILYLLIIGLVIVGFAGVTFSSEDDEVDTAAQSDSLPTRRQLRRSFFEKGELLVVYAAKDSSLIQKYESVLTQLSQLKSTRSWRNISISYIDANHIQQEDLMDKVVLLVGAVQEHPFIEPYLEGSPFSITKEKIHMGERSYASEATVLSVESYPNPFQPGLPFSLITGDDPEEVYTFLADRIAGNGTSFYRQNLDYELYRNSTALVLGGLTNTWEPDGDLLFDFSKGTKELLKSGHYRFISHQTDMTEDDITKLAAQVEKTTETILEFVGSKEKLEPITYHIYDSAEEKGLLTGSMDQASVDILKPSVHTIINPVYADNFLEKENVLVLRQTLGSSRTAILEEGLPLYFTSAWQKKGYGYWTARLFQSGNGFTLAQLFDEEYMRMESPLIRDAMAGSVVDFLLQQWGKAAFLERYQGPTLIPEDLASLESKWETYISQKVSEWPKEDVQKTKLPYLKGFNFAHEGYDIYNGFGSSLATESLQKQKELGSNAMTIVPYSFISDKNQPAPFRFSDSPQGENDAAVIHATHTATDLGMYTLLKPQVFVGDSWPGDIEMKTQADWDQFFHEYYKWIRHYAFLAEIHEMDGLSIGVEFTKATLGHPEAWRTIIANLRGLFSGDLTYCANWGEEFENIEFWDDLDFIGLNSYYPLSKADNPSDEELLAKFDTIRTKIVKVHEQFQKPIVFTEIGFRSIDHPWKNPHAEADESINQMAQQRCYEVIFKGIENEPWCQGILWWKFPSYLGYRGTDNNAFTPNNKLAEETVRTWFAKL